MLLSPTPTEVSQRSEVRFKSICCLETLQQGGGGLLLLMGPEERFDNPV